MGVIQRQSIKNSLVNYIGVIFGALSTLFIYPLDLKLYGSIQVWIASAALLIPLLTLGSNALVQKFFPFFNINGYKGFLKLILQITSLIVLLMTGILYLFKDYILEWNIFSESKRLAFNSALFVIYPISVLTIFNGILRVQAANFKRIVIPDIIQKLGFKIFLPVAFLLTINHYIDITEFKIILVGFYFLVLVLFVIYLSRLKGLDIYGKEALIKAIPKKKEMGSYMAFNLFNNVGHLLAYQIDKVMLGAIITNVAAGVYSIFLFLISVIEIPTRAVFQISGPIVSKLFEQKEYQKIDDLYKQSSINLLVVGIILFSLIWLNINNIFQIMSKGEDIVRYKDLFLFLGLAKLMEMATSINGYILIYSKYYRYNLLFIGIMAVSNVVSNYLFIHWYGIIGAGIATALSIFIYNLIKSLYIFKKMGIHPLTFKHMILGTILGIVLLIGPLINLNFNPVINIILTSGIFSILIIPILYYSKVSEDINKLLKKALDMITSQ